MNLKKTVMIFAAVPAVCFCCWCGAGVTYTAKNPWGPPPSEEEAEQYRRGQFLRRDFLEEAFSGPGSNNFYMETKNRFFEALRMHDEEIRHAIDVVEARSYGAPNRFLNEVKSTCFNENAFGCDIRSLLDLAENVQNGGEEGARAANTFKWAAVVLVYFSNIGDWREMLETMEESDRPILEAYIASLEALVNGGPSGMTEEARTEHYGACLAFAEYMEALFGPDASPEDREAERYVYKNQNVLPGCGLVVGQ